MTGSVQSSHGAYMIHDKCKDHVKVTNVTNVRAFMDHIGPMTHDRLSAEQSWGIYDPWQM
jgi:hypothetical protein